MGIFAFSAILAAMFHGMQTAKKAFSEAGMSDYAGMVGAVSVGLIGYLTGSLFLHLAFPRYFWLLVGIALAIPNVAAYEIALRQQNTLARQQNEAETGANPPQLPDNSWQHQPLAQTFR
jgi:hypothetical protein